MANRRIRLAAAVSAAVLLISPVALAIPPISGSANESARVQWRLVGPDYEPLAGYRVRLTHKTAAMAAESRETDDKGRVLLPKLVPGTYGVTLLSGDRRRCQVKLPEIVVTVENLPEFTTMLDRAPVCDNTPRMKIVPVQSAGEDPKD